MRRFFINPTQINKNCGLITDHEARHIGMVLRLQAGHTIELFDGEGMVYLAEITTISKSTVETKILARQRHQAEPPFLSLAQALVKGNKMDLIIQKATELGVSEIWPTINQHCTVTSASANQISRWQRIAHESCKQCDRPTPLLVQAPLALPQLLAQSEKFSRKIIFWENEATKTLHDIDLQTHESVLLLIGPEGGFSQAEVEAACREGFQPASLGPRILRTETAAITAIAIVQFLLGNLQTK